ncbi:glycosyltransferase family 1 protein [Rhodococcus triatomae]|uniref:Alpha-1,6-mannosyltransferase n=1 Tax=Rhodococcus triatomae TaxID=300028 RepID=A0A1G8HY35_9NOCA|nr:glycosyltransferase [Rhodococcus triatomae]QNG20908.1 glycosyltransferase family 1 protein [Rhodococcus triatomae]QNG23177.1 glycosyltransferase family 1 protein [Rhodococcus triatomae]SDI11524.1 alpha-1,6-mannosyltransferase [Rhodococcus triatomae]
MRIVQLANFYGPRSGGLRTAIDQWGRGYVARGHEVTVIVPGPRADEKVMPGGVLRITRTAPQIPGTGGYRLVAPRSVEDVVAGLRPDVLEVSDRITLRGFGRWASRRGIRSVVVSHERLDRLLGILTPSRAARALADLANRRMAEQFDAVVCTTAFAATEFDRIGAPNLVRVPLGVDLAAFHPDHRDDTLRRIYARPEQPLLLHCGRLSPEKRADRSIDALRDLRDRGVDARLVVAGDGPRLDTLRRRARDLPVTFTGYVDDRARLAALFATADVTLAPGPHETFCLSALESLAAGTPVVASRSSALGEILTTDCGALAQDAGAGFARATHAMLAVPRGLRSGHARRRAEQFGWARSVDGMLTTLDG